jgi:hypothetical protein
MKSFLAVFIGSENGPNVAKWEALTPAEREKREQEGMAAWHKWATDHRNVLSDFGAPLGETKQVNRDGISDITNKLCGYAIVKAESHEAAAKLFLNHPHFMIFPGDSAEVMECLEVPGM